MSTVGEDYEQEYDSSQQGYDETGQELYEVQEYGQEYVFLSWILKTCFLKADLDWKLEEHMLQAMFSGLSCVFLCCHKEFWVLKFLLQMKQLMLLPEWTFKCLSIFFLKIITPQVLHIIIYFFIKLYKPVIMILQVYVNVFG